jgi:hypothetical protein
MTWLSIADAKEIGIDVTLLSPETISQTAQPTRTAPPSTRATAEKRCRVADPTGTPLNVRMSPNGQIVGTYRNGTPVAVLDRALDGRGRPWVYVRADQSGAPIGWAFGSYLDCGSSAP